MTPGCTTATKSHSLTSKIRFIPASDSTTPTPHRHRPSDVTVPRPARRHRHRALRAKPQRPRYVFRRARQHHGLRPARGKPFVPGVRGEGFRVFAHGLRIHPESHPQIRHQMGTLHHGINLTDQSPFTSDVPVAAGDHLPARLVRFNAAAFQCGNPPPQKRTVSPANGW